MSYWETTGASDDWYTPRYVFDALAVRFDLDVASPPRRTDVPCARRLYYGSLHLPWNGFLWMNPPFGGRNGLVPWMDRFLEHGDGIALTPDRTSAPWWQESAERADALLFISGKVRFIRPNGTQGKSPSNGTTLFGSGAQGTAALLRAARKGLGILTLPMRGAA